MLTWQPPPPSQRVLQEMLDARGEMYRQADVTVAQGDEGAAATAGRALAAVEELIAKDDTRDRLRKVPAAGSVSLRGGKGPSQF